MPVEVAIMGFFAPTLLPLLMVCVACFIVIDLMLARFGVYRFAWHPGLLRVSLFATLFCGAALLIHR